MIVFATVEEMFDELESREIKEARLETVTTTQQSKAGIRQSLFELYVTAKVDDEVTLVVVPFHQSFEGLVAQEAPKIDTKERELVAKVEELARKGGIQLLSGAYWSELPFRGTVTRKGGAKDEISNETKNSRYL